MTAALVQLDTAPAPVRLRPAPALDPPYDSPPDRPARDQTRRTPRSRRQAADQVVRLDKWRQRAGGGQARPGGAGLEARVDTRQGERAVRQLVQLLLEVLAGRLSAWKLRTLVINRAWSHLAGLATFAEGLRGQGVTQVRLLQVHTSWPTDRAIESAVVVECGSKVRAVALRFEVSDNRWRCTCLRVVI